MKLPKLSDYSITQVPTTEYRNRRIENVDFSGQKLERLRFFGCTITNSSFDNAFLCGLRMWDTTIRNCTFRKANLRDSALGGVLEGRANHFEEVDFSEADMRGTAHAVATFTDCRFDRANLLKVDFQGSRFTRCRFAGLLREVMFYDHAFQQEAFEANQMEAVDFRGAQLRWVAFRRVSLKTALLPSDEEHIIIPQYPAFLDYAIACLQGGAGMQERILRTRLEDERKWLGTRTIGVINRLDFVEHGGDEALTLLTRLIATAPKL